MKIKIEITCYANSGKTTIAALIVQELQNIFGEDKVNFIDRAGETTNKRMKIIKARLHKQINSVKQHNTEFDVIDNANYKLKVKEVSK